MYCVLHIWGATNPWNIINSKLWFDKHSFCCKSKRPNCLLFMALHFGLYAKRNTFFWADSLSSSWITWHFLSTQNPFGNSVMALPMAIVWRRETFIGNDIYLNRFNWLLIIICRAHGFSHAVMWTRIDAIPFNVNIYDLGRRGE